MFRRRNPRIYQQSLSFNQVFMTNRGILENNPTLFEGMTASEYTGRCYTAVYAKNTKFR